MILPAHSACNSFCKTASLILLFWEKNSISSICRTSFQLSFSNKKAKSKPISCFHILKIKQEQMLFLQLSRFFSLNYLTGHLHRFLYILKLVKMLQPLQTLRLRIAITNIHSNTRKSW